MNRMHLRVWFIWGNVSKGQTALLTVFRIRMPERVRESVPIFVKKCIKINISILNFSSFWYPIANIIYTKVISILLRSTGNTIFESSLKNVPLGYIGFEMLACDEPER